MLTIARDSEGRFKSVFFLGLAFIGELNQLNLLNLEVKFGG